MHNSSAKPTPQKKSKKKNGVCECYYTVKMLDYAQSEAVRKVADSGNTVIYAPPGTEKSQAIVNVITDSVCKGKTLLFVSQKKTVLDAVYNRLGTLNDKAVYINDEHREKSCFYERCLETHQRIRFSQPPDVFALETRLREVDDNLDVEKKKLEAIQRLLTDKRDFGLSLAQMYASSYMLQKNSQEYAIYLKLIENKPVMAQSYKQLSDALSGIESLAMAKIYYDFVEQKEKNPLIDYIKPDLDTDTLTEAKSALSTVQKKRRGLFNTAKHPYYRQVLAYYDRMDNASSIDVIARLQCDLAGISRIFNANKLRELSEEFRRTYYEIKEYTRDYDCLLPILTQDGYISVIDNVLHGNASYIRLVHEALDNYTHLRDTTMLIDSLDKNKLDILNFAYEASKNYANYLEILKKLPEIRIYHELISYEDALSAELSTIMDYENITAKISKLEEARIDLVTKLCAAKWDKAYADFYAAAKNNKDFLYQISKNQKYPPIKKTVGGYPEFMLSLFPCWILSPENVSALLPLEKNMFVCYIILE